jgi:hypothetical protein
MMSTGSTLSKSIGESVLNFCFVLALLYFNSSLRERFRAILREHGHDHINDDAQLGLISSGDIDQDVPGIQCDFSLVRVDSSV